MRKHLVGLIFLAGWASLAPASWVGLTRAQTITPITIPPSGTYTAQETLSKDSYRGNAAASNLGTPTRGGGRWDKHEQDWFSLNLVAGLTYTFTEAMSGNPNDNAVLSVQNSSGVQVAFYRSTKPSGTLVYRPTVSGTYILICSRNDDVTFTSPYTLTVSVPATTTSTTITAPPVNYPFDALATVTVSDAVAIPAGSVTLSVDGGPGITQALSNGSTTFSLPLKIGIHALSAVYIPQAGFLPSSGTSSVVVDSPPYLIVPVSQAGSLSASSYRGNAASTALSHGQSAWNPAISYQDWYIVTLEANFTYTISIYTTGDSFLSIQDSSGNQIAWNDDAGLSSLGSPLASQVVFTPSSTDVYTIICSTGPLSPTTPLSYVLTIPEPIVPVSTTTSIDAPPGTPWGATVTVTVTALSETPTGSVNLSVDGGPAITQPLVNGSTTFTLIGLSVGIHSLDASYPGALGFLPSSGTGTLVIGLPNSRLGPLPGLDGHRPTRFARVGIGNKRDA
jgi:hypothetical protein